MRPALAALLPFLLLAPALAQDEKSEFDDLDKTSQETKQEPSTGDPLEDLRRAHERMVAQLSADVRAQYDDLLARLKAQDDELRKRASQRWDDFKPSDQKNWVDYNGPADSRSKVDFEKGEVEVETLVPMEDVTGGGNKKVSELSPAEKEKLDALAKKQLEAQTKKVVLEKDENKKPVLQDQLKAKGGAPITEKNADQFVQQAIAPKKIVVEDKPVVAEDGKPRIKVKVKIPLVQNHLMVRAKADKPLVDAAAKKYDLDPALVFAVIHTESCFNPKARSQAPAFGLMQLMPPTAAREAYQYLYKEDKIVTPDYLYDPANNILLGATYLHMLEKNHFSKIKDGDNRRSLMIAAYNCGPGCVNKFVVKKYDVNSMSNDELMTVIGKTVPQETREYVPNVTKRMALYKEL